MWYSLIWDSVTQTDFHDCLFQVNYKKTDTFKKKSILLFEIESKHLDFHFFALHLLLH